MPSSSHSGRSNTLLCRREDRDGAIVLALSGELDLNSVPSLRAHLKSAAQTEGDLVVELSGPRYIESTGIKALLDAHRVFVRTGRRMALAAPSPMTKRILTIADVDRVIPLFPTVEAALESLASGGKPEQGPR